MSEQSEEIEHLREQFALQGASFDEYRNTVRQVAAARERALENLRAQLDNANLVARHATAVAEGLREQLVQAKALAQTVSDIPYFKNPKIEAIVRDAKDFLSALTDEQSKP